MKILNLILFLVLGSSIDSFSQEKNVTLTQFTASLFDDSKSDEEIVQSFLSIDSVVSDKKKLVINHLHLIREELKKRKMNLNDLSYVSYQKEPEKFKGMIFPSDKSISPYWVFYKNEPLIPILIEGNKVISFSTMNKGGTRYYMIYKGS